MGVEWSAVGRVNGDGLDQFDSAVLALATVYARELSIFAGSPANWGERTRRKSPLTDIATRTE